MIIIDDVSVYFTKEISHTYKLILSNIIKKISPKLHVNTLRLTSFWEYVKNGDPIIINILRDGIALYDTGLFEPIKLMFEQGRIRPSQEAIWNYFSRSGPTMNNAQWHILQATIDLYWAVVDAAHAALMKADVVPPSPDHMAHLLRSKFVKHKKLEKKYADTMDKFYDTMKKIVHREIKSISGKQFDSYYKEAQEFVHRMKRLLSS
jgi:uncharacterized protein (UPF0332 family)